jgi:hypothetical protein
MSSNLLTYKQLNDKYNDLGNNFSFPYFYELKKSDNVLYMLGTKHSMDPNDSQFAVIKNYWKSFTEKTADKPRVAVGEYGDLPYFKTAEDAITKYAEPGFISYLASENDIEFTSLEPPESFDNDALIEKFDKDVVVAYRFADLTYRWNKLNVSSDIDKFVDRNLWFYFHEPIWKDYNFSPKNLREIYKKVAGKRFNERDVDFIEEFIRPTDTNISGLSINLRTEIIFNEIKELWCKDNLFIVYDSDYVIRLEPVLKDLSDKA